MTPEVCPNCGADVPRGARACPECGSDEETGWSEKAATDHLGLPDEEFDYDKFVAREFQKPKTRMRWYWWAVIAALLLAFLIPLILRR
jgi:predicted amidophosphoribosyltransferase